MSDFLKQDENGFWLLLHPEKLQSANIDPSQPVDVDVEQDAIRITQSNGISDEEFQAALEWVNKHYAEAFRKLAE